MMYNKRMQLDAAELATWAHPLSNVVNALVSSGIRVGRLNEFSFSPYNTEAPDGASLVEGKSVTGFSNTEEDAVQLSEVVPFMLEDELKAKGANYSKDDDWQIYTIIDGNLITGQNPASSDPVAKAVL